MGSPFSGILADIYLNYFESEYIFSDQNKHLDKTSEYFRYVNETLILFNSNTREIEILQKYLNSIVLNLKFTLETTKSNELHFSNLTVGKNKNSKVQYIIYRKTTTSSKTINSTSYHLHSYKIAA